MVDAEAACLQVPDEILLTAIHELATQLVDDPEIRTLLMNLPEFIRIDHAVELESAQSILPNALRKSKQILCERRGPLARVVENIGGCTRMLVIALEVNGEFHRQTDLVGDPPCVLNGGKLARERRKLTVHRRAVGGNTHEEIMGLRKLKLTLGHECVHRPEIVGGRDGAEGEVRTLHLSCKSRIVFYHVNPMSVNQSTIEAAMHDCVERSKAFRGSVGTGAMVAAALVRDQTIIARGVHAVFGGAHGERDLLNQFQDLVAPDDVLVVNLEPCCPSPTKKTPPCTDIILQRGVKHIAYGMTDPDARVAGNGLKILRERGVTTTGPILEKLCAEHNRGFTTLRLKGRPWTSLAGAASDVPDRNVEHYAAIVSEDADDLLRSLGRRKGMYIPQHILLGPHDTELEASGIQCMAITSTARGRIEEATRLLTTPTTEYHGITSMILAGRIAEDALRTQAFDDILDTH